MVFVFLALMVAAFYFLIIRPQRRQLATHRALVSSLEVGDEIVTNAGIYGTVDELDDTTVELEIAEDVVITVARTAISQRLGDEPEVDLDELEDLEEDEDDDPADELDESAYEAEGDVEDVEGRVE